MAQSSAVTQLLKNQGIWQAATSTLAPTAMSTGYQQLDKQLHYSGWPQGALTEVLINQNGIGEIRLLAPLLANLNKHPGYITWVNPPYEPYPPALLKNQLDLNRIIVVRTHDIHDCIWASQQALASNACSAVLVWLPSKNLSKEIRKLNLAAKAGKCWGFLFRSQQFQQQPSAAPLRIVLCGEKRQHKLSIIKQPGGWSGQEVSLDLFPERQYWNPLSVNHWPSYKPIKPTNNKTAIDSAQSENKLDETIQPSYH